MLVWVRCWRTAMGIVALWTWVSCAASRPPPPPVLPPPLSQGDVVRRHADQVCQESRDTIGYVAVDELFDTVGLADEIAAAVSLPTPATADAYSLDFIIRYGADGAATASGVWASTLDEAPTRLAATILAARVLPLGRLIKAAGFRSRLSFHPRATVALGRPIVCSPHLRHAEGMRPTGMPDGVRLVGYIGREPGDSAILVRVSIDERGDVVDIESIWGTAAALERAREIIALLTFDPALQNGEGVPGRTRFGFTFSPAN